MDNFVEKAKGLMRFYANEYNVRGISETVLSDPNFYTWSGSGFHKNHHYGDGGLFKHTAEVVETAMRLFELSPHREEINGEVVFLASLFHDYGKIWDYEFSENQWKVSKHKNLIHHVSRSALEFNMAAGDYKYVDEVTHCILAHHGLREWGSPVKPQTREACSFRGWYFGKNG